MQQFIPNGNLGACIAPAGPRARSSLPRWPSGSHRQQAHLTSHAPRFSPSRGPAGQGCHASPKASVRGWVRHPSERLGGRTVCPRCPGLWPREGAEPWAAAAAASLCVFHRQHRGGWGVRKMVPSGRGHAVLCYRACLVSFSA